MNKNISNLIKRSLVLVCSVLAAAWVVYCAQGYDAYPFSYIPLTMCTISALVFVVTGAALFVDSFEADE